jgi:MinD superfamily P-loop ATPase
MKSHTLRRNWTEYIQVDSRKCKACWKCIEVCRNNVIGKINLPFHKHVHIEHPELCKGCLKCLKVCPEKAIFTV